MNKNIIVILVFLSAFLGTSCMKDLDVKPEDPSTILSANLSDDPEYQKQVLAKIYASFILAGQGSNGGADIAADDDNFFTFSRALWNLQEITTDEAMCAWGDAGISDLNTLTWTATNPFLTALYQRLGLSVTYANEFIRTFADESSIDPKYIAEARFLRAFAYYYYVDLFGNPPFTTEEDQVGIFYPKQKSPDFAEGRKMVYDYIESELMAIIPDLGEPGFSYGRADKAAAQMLLARLYLNAEVFTGTAQWQKCADYATEVINSGAYSLAANYRQNFSADNDYPQNPEMIFALVQDGINTQGYVGTTFIIESSSDANYVRAEDYHGLTDNTNWNGNRTRLQFMNVLVDTLATYGEVEVPYDTDTIFAQCADKRVFLRTKLSPDIPSASSSGDYGIGVYKFTARNHDGTQAANYNPAYASTDFPIFRLADAYLMRAEAIHNGASISGVTAAGDVNTVRARAFDNFAGSTYEVTAADITDDFLLNERGKEFYYEAQRRTDLVRFGKFTTADYLWVWKGGIYEGQTMPVHMNVFPIPGDEVSANENISQNPGY